MKKLCNINFSKDSNSLWIKEVAEGNIWAKVRNTVAFYPLLSAGLFMI